MIWTISLIILILTSLTAGFYLIIFHNKIAKENYKIETKRKFKHKKIKNVKIVLIMLGILLIVLSLYGSYYLS